MTDTTRDHLLHLAERARQGVALPTELDQLATGITEQSARIAALGTDLSKAEDALERVRQLCELTISASVRAQAVQQAYDTLAALDEPQQPAGE
ncbi:hypothetical protein [Streptomyces sp. NPDC005969]|uniref:hypothetical protein n=1 Tax=Streptomyces sp. NPDC005969 TaxID=3156722 RepID=UPI0033E5C42B